ncbi:tetratricopeptide repeat protein, partial [Streptomyces sp. NPDC001985]|uniref:ATP-binding protein n=1 Tax=Streptomyces sp. NPDC001985 TaxID=3154406 RepID=UPI00331B055A
YADTRRLLADELGVDPRPELSRLQERILRADKELVIPGGAGEATGPVPPRPAQLPSRAHDFTGRVSFVQELVHTLATSEGSVMAVSALAGIGGVGKTTLALEVAHEARPHFPDGQLYADLRGTGSRAAEPAAVLGSFLRALGTGDSAIPDSPEERAALYRSTLDGRRVLVLLDNARDAAQVRPLLPGAPGCATVVTSRARMVDLASAHLVDLDVMSPEEALQLFTRIVGDERVLAEHEAARETVAACGFLPLAIRIAASRLAARRTWTISVLAAKLADERRRLDELQAGDLAVKATFELGYGQLDPEQSRAFRLLGLADGPDISLAAAAALLDRSAHRAEDLLEGLVDTSLLESAAPGRYRYHDLVRLYARACAERDERPEDTGAALSRLLDFYLATVSRVYAIDRPGDRLPDHLESTGTDGLSFARRQEALDWLYTEAPCLLACAQQSTADSGGLRRAVDLLWAAKDLAESGANSQQYAAAALTARDAASRVDDSRALGRAHTVLAQAHLVAGRYTEADEEAERAARFASRAGDAAPVFWADNDRGIIAVNQGRHADAERFLRRAMEGFRADGNGPGEASALGNLSRLHLFMGRVEQSIDLARQALDLLLRLGFTVRVANARYVLGVALTEAGSLAEALEELTEARESFGAVRQRLWEGTTLFRIAQVHLAAHRPARAAQHAEQALAIGCIGGDRIRAKVLITLGRALSALGQADRARACWREALALHEQLGSAEAEEVRALLGPLSAV